MKDYVLWHNMPDMHLHWMSCDLSMHERIHISSNINNENNLDMK